jgi:hypothetical protein
MTRHHQPSTKGIPNEIHHGPQTHLIVRIVISLVLQILLVVLLQQPHQDSLLFNLGIMVVAVLAIVPVASAPRWLPFWPLLMLRLLGLFPLWVFLTTLLHVLGWNGLLDWLLRLF